MISLASHDVRRVINEWRRERSRLSIMFTECTKPSHDGSDDYFVSYETFFKSTELDQLQMTVFSTDDGYTGIGIETRKRIAQRMGVRCGRDGYAVGHEPGPISIGQLIALLDAAADGRIVLRPKAGVFGLGNISAVLIQGVATLPSFESPHWRWLEVLSGSAPMKADALVFNPW